MNPVATKLDSKDASYIRFKITTHTKGANRVFPSLSWAIVPTRHLPELSLVTTPLYQGLKPNNEFAQPASTLSSITAAFTGSLTTSDQTYSKLKLEKNAIISIIKPWICLLIHRLYHCSLRLCIIIP